MADVLLALALSLAAFVGFNVGGSGTGPAFGPVVGANVVSKVTAAALMSVCFAAGAWTLGRPVVRTLGEDVVGSTGVFTLETATVVLLFVGLALFAGNYVGVPTSTSMTAVGAIAALGLHGGTLNWSAMREIVAWWLFAPVVGFWASAVVGRYCYDRIEEWIAIDRRAGPVVEYDASGPIPLPRPGSDVGTRELVGSAVLVGIGCLMAISTGASNVANAIAPLYGVGIDGLGMEPLLLVGSLAVAVGAFTIARRTLDTVGNDITRLPLTAAIVVAIVSSTLVLVLAAMGVPASFVVIATTSIVGLGWGRATRRAAISTGARDERSRDGAVDAATASGNSGAVGGSRAIADDGTPDRRRAPASRTREDAADLFDPGTTARVILVQNVVPCVAAVGAYGAFRVFF